MPTELPALPPRKLLEDMEWLTAAVAKSGNDLAYNARTCSASEWSIDLDSAAEMAAAHQLDDAQWSQLVELFRERNKAVWGNYSNTNWTDTDFDGTVC